ncbi:MAG: OmpA family protein, partial [Myxococcales bacterium]|nr:OmpA family protein [Myxococcales bacterium]
GGPEEGSPEEGGPDEGGPDEGGPDEGGPDAEATRGEDGEGGAKGSTGAGAASGRRYSARGPSGPGTPVGQEPAKEESGKPDKWIHRHPPRDNVGEFGVFGGVWFPSRRIELFVPESGYQRFRRATPEIGLRAGYYPLRWVGVEAEGAVLPTRTAVTEARATAWALRGNVIGQLGLWSVTPFLLAGVGVLGVSSDDGLPTVGGPTGGVGNDQDFALNLGGGVKVYITDYLQLRLDVRDVLSNRVGIGEGFTSSPEILLGVTYVLGKRRAKEEPKEELPPPPPEDDRDGDTVPDAEDFCPDVFGVPPRGCPQVCVDDNDADGLPNSEDKCIDDPETRNGFEDDDGCPDEIPPELDQIAGVMEGIYFDNDKDVIKPESRPVLDNAVKVLEKYPEIRVEITGHTSLPGGYRYNIDLSHRRANAVRQYLVDHGIASSRLETNGVGPDQPIDTNETLEGQARNRRIEFTILDQ